MSRPCGYVYHLQWNGSQLFCWVFSNIIFHKYFRNILPRVKFSRGFESGYVSSSWKRELEKHHQSLWRFQPHSMAATCEFQGHECTDKPSGKIPSCSGDLKRPCVIYEAWLLHLRMTQLCKSLYACVSSVICIWRSLVHPLCTFARQCLKAGNAIFSLLFLHTDVTGPVHVPSNKL